MNKMMILLLGVLLCVGCSPQRRLARLVERHPEVLRVDTLIVRDTVPIPGVSIDTAVTGVVSRESRAGNRESRAGNRESRVVSRDSVVIGKGRLEVVVRRVHDTLFIRGKCKADTVFIRRKIPFTKIVVREPRKLWVLWGVIGLLIVMVFVMLLGKR